MGTLVIHLSAILAVKEIENVLYPGLSQMLQQQQLRVGIIVIPNFFIFSKFFQLFDPGFTTSNILNIPCYLYPRIQLFSF